MNKVDLKNGLDYCRNYMIAQLTQYVLEHGDDMCDYYRDEHGIDDEVIKLIDLADCGCYFSLPKKFQAENNEDDYMYYAFWTLYAVKESDGQINLKYYCFYNNGFEFDDELSDPDHDYAENLSLAILEYIYSAIFTIPY